MKRKRRKWANPDLNRGHGHPRPRGYQATLFARMDSPGFEPGASFIQVTSSPVVNDEASTHRWNRQSQTAWRFQHHCTATVNRCCLAVRLAPTLSSPPLLAEIGESSPFVARSCGCVVALSPGRPSHSVSSPPSFTGQLSPCTSTSLNTDQPHKTMHQHHECIPSRPQRTGFPASNTMEGLCRLRYEPA